MQKLNNSNLANKNRSLQTKQQKQKIYPIDCANQHKAVPDIGKNGIGACNSNDEFTSQNNLFQQQDKVVISAKAIKSDTNVILVQSKRDSNSLKETKILQKIDNQNPGLTLNIAESDQLQQQEQPIATHQQQSQNNVAQGNLSQIAQEPQRKSTEPQILPEVQSQLGQSFMIIGSGATQPVAEKTCRICLTSENELFSPQRKSLPSIQNVINTPEIDQKNNPKIASSSEEITFVNPCKCSGSMKYVHEDCLTSWLQSRKIKPEKAVCELCRQPFKITVQQTTEFKKSKACDKGLNNFIWFICISIINAGVFASLVIFLIACFGTPQQIYTSSTTNTNNTTASNSLEGSFSDSSPYIKIGISMMCLILMFMLSLVCYLTARKAFMASVTTWKIHDYEEPKHVNIDIQTIKSKRNSSTVQASRQQIKILVQNSQLQITGIIIQKNDVENTRRVSGVSSVTAAQTIDLNQSIKGENQNQISDRQNNLHENNLSTINKFQPRRQSPQIKTANILETQQLTLNQQKVLKDLPIKEDEKTIQPQEIIPDKIDNLQIVPFTLAQ